MADNGSSVAGLSLANPPSGVYSTLAAHQRGEAWFAQDLASSLQSWAEWFNVEFKLDVPHVVLRIDRLRRSTLGSFRYGHNGFGLRGEVSLNAVYTGEGQPRHEVLGTLLHELLHGWQEAHGTPGKRNYHNRQFRAKAAELGLVVDRRGVQHYRPPPSPFLALLAGHGVDVPQLGIAPVPAAKMPGNSKLKKWSCGCTNVRCAVADLEAACLRCGRRFVLAD